MDPYNTYETNERAQWRVYRPIAPALPRAPRNDREANKQLAKPAAISDDYMRVLRALGA